MENKMFKRLSLFLICAMFFIPTSVVFGETQETGNENPYIEVYDANNNLVKSYSDEEIKVLMEKAVESNRILEPKVTDGTPYANIYDKNNLIVDSTIDGAVDAQQAALKEFATASSTYTYGATSFSNNIYVAGGSYFYNPTNITINPKYKFEGMLIKLYPQGYSTPSGSIKIGNFEGGLHVPLTILYDYSGNYKIQFVNANTNGATIYLNSGTVYY